MDQHAKRDEGHTGRVHHADRMNSAEQIWQPHQPQSTDNQRRRSQQQ